jgi:hypothetical protein
MSIVNKPSAQIWKHIPGRPDYQEFCLKVSIPTSDIPLRKVDEFIEFLTMVYGKKIRFTQKNAQLVSCILYLYERTEAGLRVASWVYQFDYETARVYA